MTRWRAAVLFFAALLTGALVSLAAEVREVRVQNTGAGPLDESSVLAFTSLRPGDDFSRSAVSLDVKNLQKSGRFSYVAASVERVPGGVAVIYQVETRPRIRNLNIVG
ncbi:MAG: hypothetical protein JXB04_06765, partial [Kiritimatiellae bacterium]|nr:hypothetical protein [Kiritimatiellia bacterium]